jgi:hypothetical protein
MAIAAGPIYLIGLINRIYDGYKRRKHFKLSIKPNLTVDFGDTYDRTYHIPLKNQDFGPAKIFESTAMEKQNALLLRESFKFTDIMVKYN